jgi:alpha-tubulin suppressor-like RCC1 family protein
MIKFVYLILYIIILFILLFIIYNYYYIIEKYVDITHFGDFTECPTCSNGQQLIGCKGLSQGSCQSCPAGTAGTGGTCDIKCSGNKYSSSGFTSCSLCNTSGNGVNKNNTACEPCIPGQYGYNGKCYSCPSNTFSTGHGNTSCTICEQGKKPDSFKTGCEDCPPGEYGDNGYCEYCPINKFSTGYGNTSCTICEKGKKPNSSNTGCEDCPEGTYGDNGYCYTCPTNHYSDSPGSMNCIPCIDGKIVNSYKTGCESRPLIQISCGFGHTVFLTSQGKVYGGGWNEFYQINSSSVEYYAYSLTIQTEIEFTNFDPQLVNDKITQVACGTYHTMFLTSKGNVYGCGNNQFFQVNSTRKSVEGLYRVQTPTKISDFPETVQITQIACGDFHTMFLTSQGKVYGCGRNDYNQVNSTREIVGGNYLVQTPTEITDFPQLAIDEKITQIACGRRGQTMFLTSRGKVYGCGKNDYHQVSSRNINKINVPTEITNFVPQLASNEYIIQIACGDFHTMFLTSRGKVYGCGYNRYKQVNSSSDDTVTRPIKITEFDDLLESNEYIIQIACRSFYTMFLTSEGKVYGCGNNDNLHYLNLFDYNDTYLMDISSDNTVTRPTEISNYPQLEYGDKIIQIACESDNTLFSTSKGKFYGHGRGFHN